jgi:azurin
MSNTHDSSENSGSFWSLANIILGVGFAGLAAVFSSTLLIGALKYTRAIEHPAPPAAPAAPTTPPAAASAPVAAAPAAPTASAPAGDVAIVNIKPGTANPMSYDTTSFIVKAGQKVKLTFTNDNPTAPLQHNFVLGVLGSKDKLIALSNGMMADMVGAMKNGFIPQDPAVLAHTKLLNPKESETLEFTAPAEKGDYPYMCTFPGHSLIMNGTMKVE